jgi:hypothetical protein
MKRGKRESRSSTSDVAVSESRAVLLLPHQVCVRVQSSGVIGAQRMRCSPGSLSGGSDDAAGRGQMNALR